MKPVLSLFCIALVPSLGFAQDNPGWQQSSQPYPDIANSLNATSSLTAGAAPNGPGALGQAPALTPAQATQSLAKGESAAAPARAMGTLALNSISAGNEADEITPEITALASGLRNNPVTIFEYVHNYIRYECYYGSKKGARLTLMEGSGNDFDQAALLVALLRAAGYSASYEYGPYLFSYEDLVAWWGLSETPYSYMTDSQFIAYYQLQSIPTSQIPRIRKQFTAIQRAYGAGYFYIEPLLDGSGNLWLTIPLCAVKFTIDGTDHIISPAAKASTTTAGINLATSCGYNRTDLLGSAGGTTGSPDYVQGLNETAIGTRLTTYTSNLLSAVRAGHDSKSVDQITGGRSIVLSSYNSFADVPQMTQYSYSTDWCPAANWTAIPTSQMSKVVITAGTYNYTNKAFTSTLYSQEVTMPSLGGKKASLAFSGNSASIRLDESLIGSSFTVSGANVNVKLEAKHNHYLVQYLDTNGIREPSDFVVSQLGRDDGYQVAPYLKGNTSAYTFAYTFGNPDKQLRKRQEQLDAYRRAGIADTDWRVLTEGLNVMGLSFYQQKYDMEQALGNMYNVQAGYHHLFGRASQEGSFYIDVGLEKDDNASGDTDFALVEHYFDLSGLFASAMEHGVLEQIQGQSVVAVSTVRMIQQANAQGLKIFRASPDNWSSVSGQLQNYSATTKSTIHDLLWVDATSRALLPGSGTITVGQWTGGAYTVESPAYASFIISKGLNGGYSTNNSLFYNSSASAVSYQAAPAYEFVSSSYYNASYTPVTTPPQFSLDPVEMSSGAYVLDKDDLTLGGEAPLGLKFTRQYHTNRRFDNTAGIGYGWSHSGNVFITERSAPDAALGGANAYQMAPFLAAAVAARDLHDNSTNATGWATSALAIHWALEQMRYKAVSVTMGTRSIQFIRMPDGSYIGSPGMNLTLTKNSAGRYVLTERHGNTLTFDASLRLSTVQNPSGATQTYAYDSTSGKIATITDAFSRALTFTWSGSQISSITDGTGRSIGFGYTGGDLTSFTDLELKVWTYQYDADHRMISLKDPQSHTIAENDYDGENRVTRQRSMGDPTREWTYLYAGAYNTEINPLFGETRYYYDTRGRNIGVIDPVGSVVYREYDGQDRITRAVTPKGANTYRTYNADNNPVTETDPYNYVTSYYYDALLHLQRKHDKRGHDTTFTYTTAHQLQTVTDQLGHVTTYGYLGNGLPSTVTDAENKTTTMAYDSWGQVNLITAADNTAQHFTNNARGDVLTAADAEGRTTTNTWNKRRQVLTTTLPAIAGQSNAVTTRVYDDSGNLQSTTDANGYTTTATYNALGDSVTTTQPALPAGDNATTTQYDVRNWPTDVVNSLGFHLTTEYDSAKHPVAVTDALNRRTENGFDADGKLTQSTDALNRTQQHVWNARDEKTQDTDALGKNTDTYYDEAGNRTWLVNRLGNAYQFISDEANRLTTTITPMGKTTLMSYYHNNQVKTIQEPSGQTTTLTYNGRNQIQTKTDPTGTITYAYDNSGLPTTITAGSSVITRTYDERGRLKTYTNADGDLIQYQYDSNNNLTRLTYPADAAHPAGRQVNYTYYARNLLATVTDWSNRVTTYQYDRLGRLTGITRPNGTSAALARDAGDQLTSIRESAGGKLFSYLSFTHDAAGQVKSRFQAPLVTQPSQHPTFAATYDVDNRLASVNGATVTHDADGNMTYGPIRPDSGNINLTYNSRNQLTNAAGISYTYDAEGVRRTITDSKGTTRDVIDPNATMSRLLIRHNPDGSKTVFVYGLGLLYEADETDHTKTYHFDQVGSTIARTNDVGSIIGRAAYSAYGIITSKDGDMASPFLYNGQWGIQTDANGLLNMRARYYSPYLMRFLNADPSGFSGGGNWFAFADGCPISNTDPFGLWSWNQTWGVVKAVGGLAEAAVGLTVGAATSWTGIGAVAGAAVVLHGADTFQAGFRQAVTDEETDSMTSQRLQSAGLSRTQANLADAGIGLAAGGAGLLSGASKTASIMRSSEAAGMSIPQALGAWERGSVALNTADYYALGGPATSALSKAAQMTNDFQQTTTKLQRIGSSLSLANTGLTPIGDFVAGAASSLSFGGRMLK